MEPQKTSISEAITELTALGYNDFSKRIIHHDEFYKGTHRLHYWCSAVMKASKSHRLDYAKWLTPKPLLEDDSCVAIVTAADFIKNLDDSIVDISVRFIKDKQVFTCYTECLSSRSIYAWDNNTYITHVTDAYDSDGPDTWTCDISKYGINKQLWYPVNVIAHSPWHNKTTGENTILASNYICFGIDQSPEMSSIGKSILPHADDIQNVSTCPTELLKDDIKPYADLYNKQMQNEVYKFDIDNRTGWLFVAVAGFVYTKDLLVMTVDKRGKRRYYSFG
jgi:hypothetical protein